MSDGRLAAILFVLAFLARLGVCFGSSIFGADGAQYLCMAERMSAGEFDEALRLTSHPAYPVLITGLGFVWGSPLAPAYAWAVLLGAGAVVPLFLAGREAFGRPAAFLAGFIYALHPYIVDVQADVMTEGPYFFFFCATVWLTGRIAEKPSLVWSALAGLAASTAYLTRPEGILPVVLAVSWPVVWMFLRRDRWAVRAGGIAVCAGVAILLALPFLLWVRSVSGVWALSAKGSVMETVGTNREKFESERTPQIYVEKPVKADFMETRYGKYVKSWIRLSYYVALPLMLLGLFVVKGWGRALFYLSFPLGHAAGMFLALQRIPYMSYRYLIPSFAMLLVLAGVAAVLVVRWMNARWPERRWAPITMVLLVILAAALHVRMLKPARWERRALNDAGAWIRANGGERPRVMSTMDQVGYHACRRALWYVASFQDLRGMVDQGKVDYFVYSERDLVRSTPPYLKHLHKFTGAKVFGGGKGLKIYVVPAR